jgi:hypothetical protein
METERLYLQSAEFQPYCENPIVPVIHLVQIRQICSFPSVAALQNRMSNIPQSEMTPKSIPVQNPGFWTGMKNRLIFRRQNDRSSNSQGRYDRFVVLCKELQMLESPLKVLKPLRH